MPTQSRGLLGLLFLCQLGCGNASDLAGGGSAMDMAVSDAMAPTEDDSGVHDMGEADGGGADVGGGADGGQASDGGIDLPDDTVVLEMDPTGYELGQFVTGDDGAARFYSPMRSAYWEIALADNAGELPHAGTEISVAVSPDGTGQYFVYDPTERYAPMAWSAPMPDRGEHTLQVDTADMVYDADALVEFAPNPQNPFAFTIASLNVSITIQGIMREVAWTAALGVFASLLTSSCNAIAPVYDDICGIIGTTVGIAGGLVRPGFTLVRAGFETGREAAIEVGKGLIGKVGEWGCGEGGKMLSKAFAEEEVGTMRDTFREAVSKYHYMLWRLEDDPPADPAARDELRRLLEAIGPQLTVMAPQIREGYVTVFSATGTPASQAPLYGHVIDRTKDVLSAAQHIDWEPVIVDVIERRLFGPFPTGGVDWLDVPVGTVEISEAKLRDLQPGFAGITLADCAVAVWQGFEGSYTENRVRREAERKMPLVYETASRATIVALEDIYGRLYGGEIPLECLVDEYEPNDDWRNAVAAPAGVAVGRDPIRLRDLSLCNVGDGTAREDDWYAFPMGAIEFDATARIRAPEGGMMGDRQPVCLELHYYGEVNELAGTPPQRIGGACGDAGNWFFDVGPYGIRRAIGESWAYLLVHVYGAADADGPVTYDLSFAL